MRRLVVLTVLVLLFSIIIVPQKPSYATIINVTQQSNSILPTAPWVFPGSTWNVSVESFRTVWVSEFLMGYLHEKVTVKNQGDRPFNAILFFLPVGVWRNLTFFEIKAKWENSTINLPWKIHYQRGDYIAIAVRFPDFLEENETFSFNISAWLNPSVFHMFYSKNEVYYEFRFAKQPLFPYFQKRKSHFIMPPTSLFVEKILPTPFGSEGNNLRFDDDKQVDPFNDSTPINETYILIRWYMKIVPLRMLSVTREIVFGLSDEVSVNEYYSLSAYSIPTTPELENAKWKTESIYIGELKGVKNITARDDLGTIETSTEKTTGNITIIQVKFRSPITAGTIYSFSLRYTLDCEDYREKKDNSYILRIPLAPYVNATINKYTLRLLIPEYINSEVRLNISEPVMVTCRSEALGWRNYKVFYITFTNFHPKQNVEIVITFTVNWNSIISFYLKILAVVMFIFVVALIIIKHVALYVKAKVTPREVVQIREKRRILEAYVTRLEEYIALDTLIEDTIRKQIPSRTTTATFFDRVNRYLDTLRKRREELYRIGDQAKRMDPDITVAINEIESCEIEIEIARELLFRDWRRFIAGEIDYEVWINRANAIISGIEKIRVKRDKLLNFLRDILDIRYKLE